MEALSVGVANGFVFCVTKTFDTSGDTRIELDFCDEKVGDAEFLGDGNEDSFPQVEAEEPIEEVEGFIGKEPKSNKNCSKRHFRFC